MHTNLLPLKQTFIGIGVSFLVGLQSTHAAELSGVVTDAFSGSALEGARVGIPELSLETTTNRRGFYQFEDVDAGAYKVKFLYVGADDKEIEATLTDDEATLLNVEMSLGVYELGDYTVRAFDSASARAANMQRSSENLRDVVASDFFG